jgi:hypothetical protein
LPARSAIDVAADNTTEALQNASLTTAPGIWMAIYDPSFDLVQLMTDGQLYTAQIDANSHTVVTIGLRYYTYLKKTANYKYGMSTVSNTNSVTQKLTLNHRRDTINASNSGSCLRPEERGLASLSSDRRDADPQLLTNNSSRGKKARLDRKYSL